MKHISKVEKNTFRISSSINIMSTMNSQTQMIN